MSLGRYFFFVGLSLVSPVAAQNDSPATRSPQSVLIEVMLYRGTGAYEIAEHEEVDFKAFHAWIQDQKKAGKPLHWSKVQLKTLEGYEAMLMTGDSTPTVSGRFQDGPRGNVIHHQMRDTGTRILVTPERDDSGRLRLTLEIDQSVPGPKIESDDAVPLSGLSRYTLRTTLALESGQTVVAGGEDHTEPPKPSQKTLCLIRATLDDQR
jgi:hypothetical protein